MCMPLAVVIACIALAGGAAAQEQNAAQKNGDVLHGGGDAVSDGIQRRLPEMRFEGVPLADVMHFLKDLTGAKIVADWEAIKSAGIDSTTPVTARLRDVKFDKALRTILDQAKVTAGVAGEFTFIVQDDAISLVVVDPKGDKTSVKAYDVRELTTPSIPGNADQAKNDNARILMKLISETVDPKSWISAGGTLGTAKFDDGNLTVRQTPDNQKAVENLLRGMRELKKGTTGAKQ